MKRTLMTSVALSAMLVGASVTGPALTSGFIAPAHAQDAEPAPEGMQDAPAEEMEEAPADDAAPEDDTTTEEVPLESGDDAADDPAAEEPADEPMTDEPATDEPPTEEPMTDEPADEPMTDEPATDEPMTDEPAEPATEESMEEETEAPAEEPATDMAAEEEPAEMFYTQQEEGEVSANTYIGQSLYNMADESIGNISDLIFTVEGGVTAAIVGVGGFLGIGEKNVAVTFDMIEIQEQPDSADVRLVIDATQETLEAAPEYQTRDDQIAEEQANQPVPATPGVTTTPMAPAPAPAQ